MQSRRGKLNASTVVGNRKSRVSQCWPPSLVKLQFLLVQETPVSGSANLSGLLETEEGALRHDWPPSEVRNTLWSLSRMTPWFSSVKKTASALTMFVVA